MRIAKLTHTEEFKSKCESPAISININTNQLVFQCNYIFQIKYVEWIIKLQYYFMIKLLKLT